MKFKFRMLHNLQFPLQNQYYTVNRLSYVNTQWYITYKSVFLPTGVWWVIDLQNVHSYLATFGTNHHLKNININCLFLNCPNVPSNQFWRQLYLKVFKNTPCNICIVSHQGGLFYGYVIISKRKQPRCVLKTCKILC